MAGGLSTILGVNLVTPRGIVAHTDADSVQAPGELGEFELLPGHIPMLTALRPGVLTIGTKLRATTTGEAEHSLSLLHTTPAGQTVLGLNIPLTNFVPALGLALLAGRPRTIYAFVSGAIISTLVGDGYERALADWIRRRASANYSTSSAEF